ncbi:MAG: hypothetical protein Q8Q01_04765 [archaeon]|nr:hypothetical protein [archaeon]
MDQTRIYTPKYNGVVIDYKESSLNRAYELLFDGKNSCIKISGDVSGNKLTMDIPMLPPASLLDDIVDSLNNCGFFAGSGTSEDKIGTRKSLSVEAFDGDRLFEGSKSFTGDQYSWVPKALEAYLRLPISGFLTRLDALGLTIR